MQKAILLQRAEFVFVRFVNGGAYAPPFFDARIQGDGRSN